MKKIAFLTIICSITTISFSQWTEQVVNPTPPKLNCVSSNAFWEGWIGGDSGTVLYTSNGGTNWTYRNNSVIGFKNVNVIQTVKTFWLSNSGKALCSANSSTTTYIYRTSNQGLNWSIVYQQPNGRIRSIVMVDTSTGFAVGDPVSGRWTILKTTNAGLSFDSAGLYLIQNGTEISSYNSSFYAQGGPSNTYFMFGTNNSRIYRSTNNGLNWNSIAFPFQNIYTICLAYNCFDCFPPPRCSNWGYACGNSADTTRTYGFSWNTLTLPGTGDIHTLYSDVGYTCYAKGSQIYGSTNSSSQFTLNYSSPNGGNYTQINLNSLIFVEMGKRAGWGVKDNGTVSYYSSTWGSVKKIGTSIPVQFSLSQNYPNPFNPITNIEFSIPSKSDVSIIIYDVMGKEITTLISERLQPGTYETEWDASNYSSGVYFYKLTTEGFTETRKMVLIK